MKKIITTVLALMLVSMIFALPIFAEPEDASSDTSEVASDVSSAAPSVSSSAPVSSKNYIPDDEVYYASVADWGDVSSKTVVSGAAADVSDVTSENTSSKPEKEMFSIRDTIKKYIWIPIGVIALCILVLVCFSRVYAVKYKAIDPKAKESARKKAAEKNESRESDSRSHKPRD